MRSSTLLSRHNILRSCDPVETEATLSRDLCPHTLEVKGRDLDTVQNMVSLISSELLFVRYGVPVEVFKARIGDSYLVIAPHAGRSLLKTSSTEITLAPGSGAILSPDTLFRIKGGRGSAVLVWKIRRHALERHASLVMGQELPSMINFRPALCLDRGLGVGLGRAMYFVADEFDTTDSVLNKSTVRERMEQTLMCALLEAQPSDLNGESRHETGIVPAAVRRVEEYIAAHVGEDITVEDLILASETSGRTLFRAFRRFRGVTPLGYLRLARMKLVHSDLLRGATDTTITSVLAERGITQFGRFAAAYKKCYGELPSETLKKSRAFAAASTWEGDRGNRKPS